MLELICYMKIEKAIKELKILNPTQRHVFFENFDGQLPGIRFKKHAYQNISDGNVDNMVVCRDSFCDRMYLMELVLI